MSEAFRGQDRRLAVAAVETTTMEVTTVEAAAMLPPNQNPITGPPT